MEIHLSARHLKLSGANRAYIIQKLSHLENLADDIIGGHVVVLFDENKSPSKQFLVKVHLGVPGPDIHVEQWGSELNAVIDKLEDKLARQLRKRKTRLTDKKRQKFQQVVERKKKTGR